MRMLFLGTHIYLNNVTILLITKLVCIGQAGRFQSFLFSIDQNFTLKTVDLLTSDDDL